jgi:hypothetical protein
MIYTALYIMFWMRAYLGDVGGGWAVEFPSFLGPKWNSPISSFSFHRAQKLGNSRAQPPPTSPRNLYAHIQNIMHGAVQIIGCAAKAFYSCPAIISRRPESQEISKEPQLNPEEESRIIQARSHVTLEKSSINYKPSEE